MINVEHELSLTRQAQLLELSRASLYYTPVEVSDADLRLMKRIDELHLELPWVRKERASGASGVPVSAASSRHRSAEPGVGG